ncbi:hypothetical protein LTR85_010902 [Meristemomyces frigidus]|nr:hypothetical protein LTR85_010902 [Meristemomyces frigidus]
MDHTDTNKLVQQLAAGFEALQEEYQKLFGQHQSLERKLATAREQYNELAKLCGSGEVVTPPLSLASSPSQKHRDLADLPAVADVLEQRAEQTSRDAANKVRAAATAAQVLRRGLPRFNEGVKIWSGPAADRPAAAASSLMPSISESPLEQDFTIEGKPSKLGCPFASMAGKKLSSHAASVLSRYNTRDSMVGEGAPSTALSSVSRVNGKDSMSQRESRRASFADPIKAEICGLSDHHERQEAESVSPAAEHAVEVEQQPVVTVENAEAGVCPIRFMDQHSPEEVAKYFEKHKHELPRSHEVCVRRYQSNEDQIRELDAKYGNLVSMIQGLGKKHKDYLPLDPEPDQEEETAVEDGRSNEKVRKWASNVSVQAVNGNAAVEEEYQEQDEEGEDERQPHFARPLRDIRVGESPSRPWGIPVPVKYLEKHAGEAGSEMSSRPAQISAPLSPSPQQATIEPAKPESATAAAGAPKGRCPFGFDQKAGAGLAQAAPETPSIQAPVHTEALPARALPPRPPSQPKAPQVAAFVTPSEAQAAPTQPLTSAAKEQPKMAFTGPVFIGYSAEDAAKILRESGLGRASQ